MKLINVLYRGGGGGEFLGSLLTEHRDVVTKKVEYDESVERWFLERNDELSQHYIDGSQPVSATDWDDTLWNIRLDHGYGFYVNDSADTFDSSNEEYYKNYLWNDWDETKTILLQSRSEDSVKYIDQLAAAKLDLGPSNQEGHWLINNGFDCHSFWSDPWESCKELTELYKDMIPEGHDWIGIDPYDLFHNDEEWSENVLYTMLDYLGLDDYLLDEWILKIDKYRVNNKKLINRTIV